MCIGEWFTVKVMDAIKLISLTFYWSAIILFNIICLVCSRYPTFKNLPQFDAACSLFSSRSSTLSSFYQMALIHHGCCCCYWYCPPHYHGSGSRKKARADIKLIGGLWRSSGGRRWYIDRRSVCDDFHSATAVATMCRSGYYRAEFL